ncbi:haloacid dehalogenase [Shewanella sp. c952]|uniref:HAD family hydrolase n=1 Tax=Shewanella sp. c952 TaxID=2815913 RepID=UPI001BBC3E5B|nr:HAD-IA family hydrolase [Shewanella sp. c952]GIU15043.1 haloacid dehalogenase [Shewanella sp. c952]
MTDCHLTNKRLTIKGVLFDLDGTLADTAPDMIEALNISLAQFGFAAANSSELRYQASHGSLALVQTALPEQNEAMHAQVQSALLNNYPQVNGKHCQLFTGLEIFLELLSEHDIPFGVVTNKPARFTRPLMIKMGFEKRMPTIISGDSTLHSKPHTAPMQLAAQQLSVQPEHILYLGDAERDMQAAKASGMHAGLAKWGYIGPNDAINDWPSDISFEDPNSLTEWLKNHLSI